MTLSTTRLSTPLGTIRLFAREDVLEGVYFEGTEPEGLEGVESHSLVLQTASQEIREYLAGTRRDFTLNYRFSSGTPFQNKVWASLANIPYGSTWSYKQQAAFIGSPLAVRAVGAANGANPLCIVLPCHRVVGSSGRLTGYAGGIHIKEHLLKLESSRASPTMRTSI